MSVVAPCLAMPAAAQSPGGAFYVSERIAAGGGKSGGAIEDDLRRGGSQGPGWRIGRDGAIYGITLTGAFKLQ